MSTEARTGSRTGWLTFAAVVMISVGCLRVISAIYYFADSSRVNDVSTGAFAHHLVVWGIWDLLIAALAIVQSFLILAADPWFGFAALLIAILVVYGLATNDVKGEGLR